MEITINIENMLEDENEFIFRRGDNRVEIKINDTVLKGLISSVDGNQSISDREMENPFWPHNKIGKACKFDLCLKIYDIKKVE